MPQKILQIVSLHCKI